ncbi:hypothetical protein GCM10009647_075100 [Streptomyces sanglieri]
MSHIISVIGTEAFVEEKSDSYGSDIMNQISDWWEDEVENSDDDYDASFTYIYSPTIPESAIEDADSLSERRREADDWLEENYNNYDNRASIQILDWVGKSGDDWPIGNASVGVALQDTAYKTGITDVAYFEDPAHFFSEVEEYGTVFHELLHNYSVLHEHGAVNASNNTSFILSAGKDEDDDSCYWIGDPNQRTDWMSTCSESEVHNHVDDNT